MMIEWISKDGERRGRFEEKRDTTVFVAKRNNASSTSWDLWGAFIPDSEEPVFCKSFAEVQGKAATYTMQFERKVFPRYQPAR